MASSKLYRIYFKTIFDFIVSIIGLALLSPFIIFLIFGLLLKNQAGIFFLQKRIGKNERFFSVIKFKTMNEDADALGNFFPDSERLTKIGSILRKSSFDEIPQLINVIKGEMSLVGPRPLLPEYLPLYNEFQKRRHEVKPGITGWAQVNGRNAISWEEKFKLDVWYVDNQSFWLDMKILWLTIRKVLVREGINQDGQATMEPFKGSGS